MHKIIVVLLLFVAISNVSAQYQMDITANYNLPTSSDFSKNYKPGLGASADIFYVFKESGFSASLLFGFNSFRATSPFEQTLKDNNTTNFEYKYQINYYTFPLILSANYMFFYKKKFHLISSFGVGGNFMELKQKQIGQITSDTQKDYFNEWAIYPSIGISYEFMKDVSVLIKSGYHLTFGSREISYVNVRIGILYKI